ncbi:MAG TPA: RDD family protein [Acidimicrobiales bacterium]|jgi:uncharacterized RDD family membrane protein YckC|nr:RDD family protein [Acidimicrobiales bacterium]
MGYGGPPLANYGQRLGGWIIDWLILLIPCGLVSVATDSIHTHNGATGSGFNVGMPGSLLSPIIVILYGTLMCGRGRGQTIGMMAAGTRAVNTAGQPIGYPMALWRAVFEWVLAVLLFIPWVIDILWPIWDPQNQTLHDKVSRTVVVQSR